MDDDYLARGQRLMVVLRVAPPVRQALGVKDIRDLQAGLTLPERVQCYVCDEYVETATAGAVELSAVQVAATLHISAWSHTGCAHSRVLTADEFEQATVKVRPAPPFAFNQRTAEPGPDSGGNVTGLIIDGRPVNL